MPDQTEPQSTVGLLSASAMEPIMAASFPAQGQQLSAHSLLRTSALPHRRVNAVWAYGRGVSARNIATAEKKYGSLGQDTVFKISSAPTLDAELRAAGYVEEGPTPVYTLPTEATSSPGHIVLSDEQDLESVIRYWMLFTAKPGYRLSLYLESYQQCAGGLGLAFALVGSQVVSVGMAHNYADVAAISNVATAPDHRRQGHGRAITQALMAWAHRQGTKTTAIQVEADNSAALSIYGELGFEKAYDSWYLRKARNEPNG